MSVIGLVWDRSVRWIREPKVQLCSSKIDALWETCCARWSTWDETNTMKDPLYFVTHEMCRKREKRERERPITCFIFSHLNTFQLLFNPAPPKEGSKMTLYLLNTKVESFLNPMYFYINVYKNRLHWSHFWLHFSILNYFVNFRRSRVNLGRDILSFSLTWPMRHVSFHIKQKNNQNFHETL